MATNSNTSGKSFAGFVGNAANGTVQAQFYADGNGSGPLGSPSGNFGTSTNHPVGLFTNNTERMVINTSGQVGIGTNKPANQLDVFAQSYYFGVNSAGYSAPSGSNGYGTVAVKATGGSGDPTSSSNFANGADGLDATGGSANSANGGAGITATGGSATNGSGGSGVVAYGGNSGNGLPGSGVYASSPAGGMGVSSSATSAPNALFGVVATYNTAAGLSNGQEGTTGVWGDGNDALGIGVFGDGQSQSAWVSGCVSCPVGVWGDSGGSEGGAVGMLGSSVVGNAFFGINGQPPSPGTPSASPTAVFWNYGDSSVTTAPVLQTPLGNGAPGCTIDNNANLTCIGTKSAVVPVDDGGKESRSTPSSPPKTGLKISVQQNFPNGSATISLEPIFAQTVNTAMDYRVFLTPDGDCKGLYVAQKSANSFDVRELGGGTASIAFDYRIVARRKGYENIRLADKTKLFEPPEIVKHVKALDPKMAALRKARLEKMRELVKRPVITNNAVPKK